MIHYDELAAVFFVLAGLWIAYCITCVFLTGGDLLNIINLPTVVLVVAALMCNSQAMHDEAQAKKSKRDDTH